MIKMEQIFDYMDYTVIVEKYDLSKEVIQSIELSKVVELDILLADKADAQLVSALKFSNIQKLVFTDFKYIERLNNLLNTYNDIDYSDLNTLLKIISDSQKSIDDFSDEIFYEGLQIYKDTRDILTSFLYLYYRQTHTDSKEEDILNNMKQCLELPESYYCNYMTSDKEIRTKLQLPEYQQLLSEVKQSTSLFPEISFKKIEDLNIVTASKFLHALNGNPYLSSTIKLFDSISLNTSDIFQLADSVDEYSYSTLTSILNLLFHDNTLFTAFVSYWQKSGFALDMLTLFYTKATSIIPLPFDIILKNQMTFLSFLYHESYYDIVSQLNNLDTGCTNLMIYALSNSKHHFLSLLLENKNVSIESLGRRSVLFSETFYKEYFNIDSLDAKGLERLLKVNKNNVNLELLEKGRSYTLNEITLLQSTDDRYYQFYHMLDNLPIDKRILLTKQLKKQHILSNKNWDSRFDDKLTTLAKHLSNKTLYDWLYQDFAHIKGINAISVCKLLMLYDAHTNIIQNLQTMGEVKFLFRSFQDIDDTFDLSKLKQNFISYDTRLNDLFSDLSINQEFIAEHYDNIYHFWLHDGVSMYFTYKQKNQDKLLHSNLKLIVKAELAGKLKELKYYKDDLEKEIVYYDISKESKEAWIADNEMIHDNITIKECDDFISIFQIGVVPVHTCLNYADGSYSKCLLSNFDSNKKLVNIFMDNVLVGRAIFRLTKSMFGKNIKGISDVSFTDVSSNNSSKKTEYLTLFLEKAYFSGINEKKQAECVQHLLQFLKQKAVAMHIKKVMFSTEYDKYLNFCTDITSELTSCAIYISRSKSGMQYLDSFLGYNDTSKEGHYITTKCNSILF